MWDKYLADFLRDTLAAVAGAGFGAWLGARLAFRFARKQANADHKEAAKAAAGALAAQRATAGNLAIFALSQMYNDLVAYKVQMLDPANGSDAPWFWMMPMTAPSTGYYQVNLESLAFLFQSQQREAPILPMKLSIEESRFAVLLDTIQHRAEFHQEQLAPLIERVNLRSRSAGVAKLTDQQLRAEVGERIYATLRNYYSDIATLIPLGLQNTKRAAEELRAVLTAELPGQAIIGFDIAETLVPGGSPTIRARNKFAQESDQRSRSSNTD